MGEALPWVTPTSDMITAVKRDVAVCTLNTTKILRQVSELTSLPAGGSATLLTRVHKVHELLAGAQLAAEALQVAETR